MLNLITLTDPRSATAEAMRTLRTNLMFSSVENPSKHYSSPPLPAKTAKAN